MSEKYTLDASGLLCPLPVIRTQQKIQQLQVGDKLTVTATDPGVKYDIPAWCRIHGHEVVGIEMQDESVLVEIIVGMVR